MDAENLRRITLFSDLTETQLEKIKACLHEKHYKKGEILFYEGKSCERIFVLRSGHVKIFRTSPGGKEQVMETLGPGDTCACNPGSMMWCCSTSGEAMEDATVWYLSRSDYVEMIQNDSALARTLNRLFAERLRNMGALVEQMSLMNVKTRLVSFLLDMEVNGVAEGREGGCVDLPFTRDEIASRLGIARETVTRQLHRLKKDGFISVEARRITILNKKGLKDLLH